MDFGISQLVAEYPIVAKCLRDDAEKKEHSTHTCAGFGTGYKDLDQLAYAPQDLEFIIELIKVEYPGEYVKEVWQMSDEEKLSDVPILKEEGNKLYKEDNYRAASEKYYLAIAYLQQLILKEVVKEPKWKKLKDLEVPLMLNYALCKLKMKEYYETIKHCTTVLEYDDENLKALYRRGEAQIEIWNFGEAKSDFEKVLKLDPSLKSNVEKRLEKIHNLSKEREKSDAFKFKGKLFK